MKVADYCDYKVIVKGKKNACYAFYGSMPCYDDKWIESKSGTDDDYTLYFQGNCKWAVDYSCGLYKGSLPIDLPENADAAYAMGENHYIGFTVKERSRMFNVEVLCNSADEEIGILGAFFEHYKNGEKINDECPEELREGCLSPSDFDEDELRAFYDEVFVEEE
jgi:hypothetical protein